MDGHNQVPQAPPGLFRRLDAVNRERVVDSGLGIRTSADIFDTLQREYEQAEVQRGSRRRQTVSQEIYPGTDQCQDRRLISGITDSTECVQTSCQRWKSNLENNA